MELFKYVYILENYYSEVSFNLKAIFKSEKLIINLKYYIHTNLEAFLPHKN